MSGSVLTYLISAEIRDEVQSLVGEVQTPPLLVKTDGVSLTYACDVRITGYDEWLRNVPIANGNKELIYARPGAAVTLTRNKAGRFEVTGFAKRKPGTRNRVPVDLTTMLPGESIRTGRWTRLLTFGELATLGGGFGIAPLGAYAVFDGDTLVSVGV